MRSPRRERAEDLQTIDAVLANFCHAEKVVVFGARLSIAWDKDSEDSMNFAGQSGAKNSIAFWLVRVWRQKIREFAGESGAKCKGLSGKLPGRLSGRLSGRPSGSPSGRPSGDLAPFVWPNSEWLEQQRNAYGNNRRVIVQVE